MSDHRHVVLKLRSIEEQKQTNLIDIFHFRKLYNFFHLHFFLNIFVEYFKKIYLSRLIDKAMVANLTYSNTSGSTEEPLREAINSASDILGSYIIPSVSAIGVILNIFSIFILNHKSLKHNFYKYLICKSIINLLTCVVGMGFKNSYCRQCSFDDNFEMMIYRNYGVCIPIRILLLTSVLSEIVIV